MAIKPITTPLIVAPNVAPNVANVDKLPRQNRKSSELEKRAERSSQTANTIIQGTKRKLESQQVTYPANKRKKLEATAQKTTASAKKTITTTATKKTADNARADNQITTSTTTSTKNLNKLAPVTKNNITSKTTTATNKATQSARADNQTTVSTATSAKKNNRPVSSTKNATTSNTTTTAKKITTTSLVTNNTTTSKTTTSTKKIIESAPAIKLNKGRWTKEEDQLLIKAYEKFRATEFRKTPWKEIAKCVSSRDNNQCRSRIKRCLDEGIVHGKWTPEEDQKLLSYVEFYGKQNWAVIASQMETRCDTQCHAHYHRVLEEIKHGTWTRDEDERLLKAVERLGENWSQVAEEVGGRINIQCSKRFRHLQKHDEK